MSEYFFKEENNTYYVKVSGCSDWISVTQEVYKELKHSIWREEKAKQRYYARHLSLDYEYSNGVSLEAFLPQKLSLSPEHQLLHEAFLCEVWKKIQSSLSSDELEIFNFLIIGNYTEAEYAALTGKPRSTIGYRKRQLLKKLKILFENFN